MSDSEAHITVTSSDFKKATEENDRMKKEQESLLSKEQMRQYQNDLKTCIGQVNKAVKSGNDGLVCDFKSLLGVKQGIMEVRAQMSNAGFNINAYSRESGGLHKAHFSWSMKKEASK